MKFTFKDDTNVLCQLYIQTYKRLKSIFNKFQEDVGLKWTACRYQEIREFQTSIISKNPIRQLRVVFDVSAKMSTGIFLNEIFMVGPMTQDDIFFSILGSSPFAFITTYFQHILKKYTSLERRKGYKISAHPVESK